MIEALAQSLFVYRIFVRTSILSDIWFRRIDNDLAVSDRNKILSGCHSILVAAQFTLFITYSVELFKARLLSQLGDSTPFTIAKVLVGVGLSNEVALSTSLLWFLYQKRTGFRSTDSIVKRIITVTIATGLVMVALGIAFVIALTVAPKSFLYIALDFVASKRKLLFPRVAFFELTASSLHQLHVCAVSRPPYNFLVFD